MLNLLPSLGPLLLLFQAAEGGPAEAPPPPGLEQFIPFIAIGFIFYFLLIRPESKKRKQQESFQSNLSKGDKVMTSAGILGSVADIRDDVVTLQVADNVRIRFLRGAIQSHADPKEAEKKTEAEAK